MESLTIAFSNYKLFCIKAMHFVHPQWESECHVLLYYMIHCNIIIYIFQRKSQRVKTVLGSSRSRMPESWMSASVLTAGIL